MRSIVGFMLVLSFLLVGQAVAQCDPETDDNCLSLETDAFNSVDSITSENTVFVNPLLRFEFSGLNDQLVTLPSWEDRLLELHPVDGFTAHCRLLLVGFGEVDPNDDSVNLTLAIPINGDRSVPIYAYCTRMNLPGLPAEIQGAPFPGVDAPLFSRDRGDTLNLVPAGQQVALQNMLQRIRDGACSVRHFGEPQGRNVALGDFVTQLAVFAIYDDPNLAFQRFFTQARNPVFARDYTSFYCLLGMDPSAYEASSAGFSVAIVNQANPTASLEGLAPLDIHLRFDAGERHISDGTLTIRWRPLSHDDASPDAPAEREIGCVPPENAPPSDNPPFNLDRQCRLQQAGIYDISWQVEGAPFARVEDAETGRVYTLERATATETITVRAPQFAPPPPEQEFYPLSNLPLTAGELVFALLAFLVGLVVSVVLIGNYLKQRAGRIVAWLFLIALVIFLAYLINQGV